MVLTPGQVFDILRRFDPDGDGEARKSRELTLALLEWSEAPFSRRTFTPGHVTCTGLVLSLARDSFLLVHHRRLERWLLPGGHVEDDDATPADAARREVIEETGAELTKEPGMLVGCDVHPIPGRRGEPLHLHHDLIFGFEAQNGTAICSPESRAVVWRSVADVADLPGSIQRCLLRWRGHS